ncbi:tyrosine-type recombinase/integrase [Maridesulfovibrio bastinii]|uniref:tyrosine-type recombinase/integrase n=1 Tax=Maridesulfovibrio bastinii TaxID=47157 RepID=UPI00146FA727|nr:site-specific integrase [Maridesulfovibrio bastinii]
MKKFSMNMVFSARPTLFSSLTKYLTHCKSQYSEKTYKEKTSHAKLAIKHFGKDRTLETITPSDAAAFFDKLFKKQSGYAVNKVRKNLNAFWKWASVFVEGFPQILNPIDAVPKKPEERKERYVPPKDDFEKVLKVVEGQDYVLLKTFYFTGARRGAIYGLKWSDILFDQQRIRLWTMKRKNGNKEYALVPLLSELKELLLDWKSRQPIRSEYVFVNYAPQSSTYGGPYVDRIRFMHKVCEKAGVTFFGYHSIRHLTATMLYHAGHPISVIQRILMHKNPNTTVRYLRDLGLDRAFDAIDGTI